MQENDPTNLQEPINPDQQGFETEDYLSQQNQTVSGGELNEGLGQEYIQSTPSLSPASRKPGDVQMNPANQPRRFGLFGARNTGDKANRQKPGEGGKDTETDGPKTDLPGVKSAAEDKKKEEKDGGPVGAAGRSAAEMKKIVATSGGNGFVAAGQYLNKLRTSSQFRSDQLKTMSGVRKVQLILLCLALVLPLFIGMIFFGSGGTNGDNTGRLADTTGTVGKASGDGTYSAGGIFTCEVRSFLDTIAFKETGPEMTLAKYGSSQDGHQQFDPADPKWEISFPPRESSGRNIGRYQIDPTLGDTGDIEDAQKGLKRGNIPFTIKGFSPAQQDYVAIGRWIFSTFRTSGLSARFKQYGSASALQKLLEGGQDGFKTAVLVGSSEFASMPVIEAGVHAGPSQSHVTFEEYYGFYQKRLQHCGTEPQVGGSALATAPLPNIAGAKMVYPRVPGAEQGCTSGRAGCSGGGQCGMTSTMMVSLFYKPSYREGEYFAMDGNIATDGKRKARMVPNKGIDFGISSKLTATTGKKWVNIAQKEKTSAQLLASIKASIDDNAPVIVYTKNIFFAGAHIYVLVGYDATTFYANNPYYRGVDEYTNKDRIDNGPLTHEKILSAGAKDANPVLFSKYHYSGSKASAGNQTYLVIQSKYVK